MPYPGTPAGGYTAGVGIIDRINCIELLVAMQRCLADVQKSLSRYVGVEAAEQRLADWWTHQWHGGGTLPSLALALTG